MLNLIRVRYGKPDTPENMREYKINGIGAVGTIKEFKDAFPSETFKITDNISKKGIGVKKVKKVF